MQIRTRLGIGFTPFCWGLAVAVYTIAALVVNWWRALPLAIFEVALLMYAVCERTPCRPGVAALRHRCWQRCRSALSQLPLQVRVALPFLLFGLHLLVLIFLGARQLESWLPVVTLCIIVVGCSHSSSAPRQINWSTVGVAFSLQFWFGVLLTRTSFSLVISYSSCQVTNLLAYASGGAVFVFGAGIVQEFAFIVLPIIIFFASLTSVLLYTGLLQLIFVHVGGFFSSLLQVSAVEGTVTVANIFLSMTEAPLLLKALLPTLSRSQLFVVMTGGFASVAGSVLGAYITLGIAADQLISACLMSAPAALALAKLLEPELPDAHLAIHASPSAGPPSSERKLASSTEADLEAASDPIRTKLVQETAPASAGSTGSFRRVPSASLRLPPSTDGSLLEAAASGALGAIPICSSVLVMLIAFVSLIALVDDTVELATSLVGFEGLTFTKLIGTAAAPLAFMMGVPASECLKVGELIGVKLVVNEFVAYKRLGDMLRAGELSRRAELVATYSLCGFSNIGSMGIMVGALSGMAPGLKAAITRDVVRALIAGTLACFSTACVASALFENTRSDLALFDC